MTNIELIATTAGITLIVCAAIAALVIVTRIGRPEHKAKWTYHSGFGDIGGDDLVALMEAGRRLDALRGAKHPPGYISANREFTIAEAEQAMDTMEALEPAPRKPRLMI